MNIVVVAHPQFLRSQSMPRFANMLQTSLLARGHAVQMWAPKPCVFRWVPEGRLRKWAGYVDQYLLFPCWLMWRSSQQPDDTLFVFADQALGPWVPRLNHRPHVVHVHDLLALRSALGLVPENRTGWSGRLYQRYIRHGFAQARHFISISHKTRDDLNRYGNVQPTSSDVVYNGLNYPYAPLPAQQARRLLSQAGLPDPEQGMVLHVSGNQWYKNVAGVIRIYAHYARGQAKPLPLWLVGDIGGDAIKAALTEVPPQGQVLVFQGLDTPVLQACYSLARAFLFPSLAEGFGWPLIEAQACGCPVITTDEAPMTEAAGPAARYLPRVTADSDAQAWAAQGAAVLWDLLNLPADASYSLCQQCLAWPTRFNADAAIEGYLRIYERVLAASRVTRLAM
jgi:glycosyltransferase involved in cell wall biosynthesis